MDREIQMLLRQIQPVKNAGDVGAWHYRAPERLRGEKGDERSDIYSAGAIFFELVTGRPPSVAEPLLSAHQALLDRMLASDPAERFPTAQALLDALK